MWASRTILLLAILLAGCATSNDATSTRELRAQVETTMRAFASMDVEGVKGGLTEDVVAFEMDMENKPVRLGSRAEVIRFAENIFSEMKKMGATLTIDTHAIDCHATPALGFCTVEFDLKATMPNGSVMTQPTRNTIVLRKDGQGWKWVHWQSSLSEVPAEPHS